MPDYLIPSQVDLPAKRTGKTQTKRVVIVTNLGANSLEYFGPLQVFAEAAFFLNKWGRSDLGYDVEIVSTEPGTVYSLKGLSIIADTPYHSLRGPVDTLIFQAVDEKERCLRDKRFMSWVARMSSRVRRVVSVCAGAFILAEAGILDGRRATTHWVGCDEFRRRYPKVLLDPEPIYIKDGHVYTSAGSTAGLDLTLALVEEDYGQEFARRIAQGLVMYLKRPGNQAQFSVHISARFPKESRIRDLQIYVSENLDGDLSVETLAEQAGMSPRNFARVFTQQVGLSPGRFVEQSRLERARQWLEESSLPIAHVARRCGYRSPDGLRLAFDRHLGVSPREYRQRFTSSGAP